MEKKIGNVSFKTPFFMAPLAGITDAPTRKIYADEGASLVYSEMVSAKGLYYGDKKTEVLLSLYEGENPAAFQIFGSDPEVMAWAAKELDSRDNHILDINMGCPVPKVVKNGDGSALLKNPDKVYEIAKAVVENSTKAVTCKIRIGFDSKSINAVENAKAIEAAGAAAVAVHGRTREQYYSGEADWEQIRLVKEAVNIPVIGNGDVDSGKKAMDMLNQTGCDFVMIGRGAMGNPWLFREVNAVYRGEDIPPRPTMDEIIQTIKRHTKGLIELKGEHRAIMEMRKHIGWYLKGVHGSSAIRGKLNTISTEKDLNKVLDSILNR